MDYPLSANDLSHTPRARGPVAIWFLVALIGIVLGGAALAAALTTDTRDYAARHASVLRSHAL
jgi:hypothetical protein